LLSETIETPSLANMKVRWGRMEESDLLNALGDIEERKGTVCYVCSIPSMTDHCVEIFEKASGMEESRVFSEKWW